MADLVRQAALTRGDQPALRTRDSVVTWADLDDRVSGAAAFLAPLGGPVAIALPNIPEFAAAYFGTLRAGLVAVPVNPGFTARELRHVLTDSTATTLIATQEVLDAVEGPVNRVLATALPLSGTVTPAHQDLAVLLYTSGTAGAPKGAMLTHRALLANHEQLGALSPAPVGPSDVVLLALPLFHAYGLNSGLGAVAYHGACGVLEDRFDPAATLALVASTGVTTVVGVPPMFVAWSDTDGLASAWAGVHTAVCGAAPLPVEVARRFSGTTGKPVHQGYGLTEAAPVLTSTLASPAVKPGSIGRPIPGVSLRLVDAAGGSLDPDDDDGDLGEIVVRGSNLFEGYWPDALDGPGADGWWATGDVAYFDEDGDLFLVDRIGELILVSGFIVYPREVEQVVDEYPGVAESAATGIPHPYTGQTVKVFVVRSPGSTVTAAALLEHCEKNLARFKCPTVVEFVASLPHSATGKVRKSALS